MKKNNLIEQRLLETANSNPNRVALQYRDAQIDYDTLAQIFRSSDSAALNLNGIRIVLLLPDGVSAYLSHLLFFLKKAVVVPVSVQTSSSRINKICNIIKPHLVLTNTGLLRRHSSALEGFVCLAFERENIESWFKIQEQLVDIFKNRTEVEEQDIRSVVFTSGSTGEPKGVCLSENNLISAAGMNVFSLSLDSSRTSLVTVPLYDYYGFIQIYSHIIAGAGIIIGESVVFHKELFQRISQGATDLVTVPFSLKEIIRAAQGRNEEVLRHLSVITSSSDMLTEDLVNTIFNIHPAVKIYNIYGLTEAGRASFKKIDAHTPATKSIGIPSPGVKISLDADDSDTGEIIIEGPNVMKGYLAAIENDKIVHKHTSGMRTGDLGRYNDDGEIILLGRRDHMINIRGSKIHPGDIEKIALQVKSVKEALAWTTANEQGETEVNIDVVPENGQLSIQELQEHLRKNLHPLFLPKQIFPVTNLSRTELGAKLIRKKELV